MKIFYKDVSNRSETEIKNEVKLTENNKKILKDLISKVKNI